MTKLTDAKAAELRALCEKATPGPWVARYTGQVVDSDAGQIADVSLSDSDAFFIAASRTAIPALLNERDELIKERDHFRKLDSEAATYVESVICMRTGFSGEPPYVGWKGLGLALNEALDERDAAIARAEKAEAENKRLAAAYDGLRGFIIRCATDEKPGVTAKEWLNAILFRPDVQAFARAALNASKKETEE
jgi:hypothetical protein